MSGTSLDGLDIACCNFHKKETGHWQYEMLHAQCVPYSDEMASSLQNAVNLSGGMLIEFHKNYGLYLAEAVSVFIERNQLRPSLIASHGHTIFHDPGKKISFQLGDGAAIYAETGIATVSDFRSVDVLSGGQGAPLVPVADKLLFSEYDFCLNLGGIANISYDNTAGERLAYDVSPCNLLLNYLARQAGQTYDKNGDLAAKGKVIPGLMDGLEQWEYYRMKPPKSLDKEALMAELIPILDKNFSIEDKMATLSLHIAQQIQDSVNKAGVQKKNPKMLITGGGAFNRQLVKNISHLLPEIICVVPEDLTVNFKEAIAFAFLGLLRAIKEPNSLSTVTGASKDTIGGSLYGSFY